MDIRLVVLTVLFVAVSGHPHGRICPVSRYVSVSSTDMKILKLIQSESEQIMSTNAMRCYRRMLRNKPSVCDLQPSDRLILTLERVSLAVDVLTNLSTSDPSDSVSPALLAFLKLKDDLMICREAPEHSEPASHSLQPWLRHLQHFKEIASTQCVQEAVLLSLISLMVEDVTCWAVAATI